MSKTKIVLASVLKPVTEPRMYEKFAISIAGTDKYEVHIIGYESELPASHSPNIHFHPLFDFPRISFKRIMASWKYYKTILKLKPDLIVINTHEYLIVTSLYRILFGTEILYDVQENYFRNIWYQDNFPPLIKQVLALWVRAKEWLFSPFISHFLLAEEGYKTELSFIGKKFTVIANKFKSLKPLNPKKERIPDKKPIKFTYTGTISKEYGIEEAVVFTNKFSKTRDCQLNIIGYCPNGQLFTALKQKINNNPKIFLTGGNKPVSHFKLLKEIEQVDCALAPYRRHKSTENCIPAKFYEYIAFKIPVLAPNDNPYWIKILSKYPNFLFIDFQNPDFDHINQWLASYSPSFLAINEEIYWAQEESKLLNVINNHI